MPRSFARGVVLGTEVVLCSCGPESAASLLARLARGNQHVATVLGNAMLNETPPPAPDTGAPGSSPGDGDPTWPPKGGRLPGDPDPNITPGDEGPSP